MTKRLLTINSGSSSIKISIFKLDEEISLELSGEISRIGSESGRIVARIEPDQLLWDQAAAYADNASATMAILHKLEKRGHLTNISLIGHRIVHGGPKYSHSVKLTSDIEAELQALTSLAPLHMQANIDGISIARSKLPLAEQFACFDTAFHSKMPAHAQYSGLPASLHGGIIRRYGFHGLSCEYALIDLVERSGKDVLNERILIAHLGAGSSITAIHNGKSVATTMGFTPLSGLPMATRSGDIDPGLIFYLINELGWDSLDLHNLLQNGSGLFGLSGQSSDMRILTASDANAAARYAVASYCYQARKHLGGLVALMGGLDRLIFTGGIGENSPLVRVEICSPLSDYFGLGLDLEKNLANAQSISAADQAVTVEILKCDEAYVMACNISEMDGLEERTLRP